jgi:hypothetical protein
VALTELRSAVIAAAPAAQLDILDELVSQDRLRDLPDLLTVLPI